MWALWMLAAGAGAGEPPCVAIEGDDFLEGEHFWITWDEGLSDPEHAQENLDWAEEARTVYTEELGYAFTDATILIRVEQQLTGAGGLATTVKCDDGASVPLITLYADRPGDAGRTTTMHEVVHAVQYAYMGDYLDAIGSWPWWMEGCASWMTTHAADDHRAWGADAADYLETPWLGLHETLLAYGDPQRAPFLYGTGLIAQHIEDVYGIDAVRATWEYGATVSGTPIPFPEAVAAAGIEWKPFWRGFMAMVTVLDLPLADEIPEGVRVEKRPGELPAEGAPDADRRPEGTGLSLILFRKSLGEKGRDLEVRFSGDPSVPWLAVLVRTTGRAIGGTVQEVVPLEVGTDGEGVARLTGFDGGADGWLVVSPQDTSLEPRDYSWSADLVAPIVADEKGGGCGCAAGAVLPGGGWVVVLCLLGWRRRRARSGRPASSWTWPVPAQRSRLGPPA